MSRSRTGWCQYLSLLPRREEEGTVLRTVKGLGRRSLPGGGWKGRRGGGNIQPTLWTPVVVVAPMAPRASRDLGVMIPPPPSHPVPSLRELPVLPGLLPAHPHDDARVVVDSRSSKNISYLSYISPSPNGARVVVDSRASKSYDNLIMVWSSDKGCGLVMLECKALQHNAFLKPHLAHNNIMSRTTVWSSDK